MLLQFSIFIPFFFFNTDFLFFSHLRIFHVIIGSFSFQRICDILLRTDNTSMLTHFNISQLRLCSVREFFNISCHRESSTKVLMLLFNVVFCFVTAYTTERPCLINNMIFN